MSIRPGRQVWPERSRIGRSASHRHGGTRRHDASLLDHDGGRRDRAPREAVDERAATDRERSRVRHERGTRYQGDGGLVTRSLRTDAARQHGDQREETRPGKSALLQHVRYV